VRGAGKYACPLALPQHETEALLGEALRARGGREDWQTCLTGLQRSETAVTVTVGHACGGEERTEVDYVVGADGAGSTVRRALGIEQAGGMSMPAAFLADVALDPPPRPGVAHLNVSGGGVVGVLALDPETFRVFGALSETDVARFRRAGPGQDVVSREELQRWFDRHAGLAARITAVEWSSIYPIGQRIATQFQAGRVFLAGDAAHVHAPAGGQGMNLGIGDAMNLAWKLAAVHTGQAHPALLETYESERRGVARVLRATTDRAFHLEARQSGPLAAARRGLLPIAATALSHTPPAWALFERLLSQTWIAYRASPAVAQSRRIRGGVASGDRIPPDLLTHPGAAPHGIPHVALLLTTTHPALPRAVCEVLDEALPGTPVRVLSRESDAARRLAGRGSDERIILARPDGHAGYVGPAADPASLRDYLLRWYPPQRSTSP
jgi:2-polyprenyl-6-methoxyphenol hydroxylase-like FAD-dependent oxidoreductase